MSDIAEPIRYQDYARLIQQCASKGYSRLRAAGCSIDRDDVVGEMNLTFALALQKFDASLGVKFSTYLVRAIWQNFNRWADSLMEERHVSLDTAGSDEDGEEPEGLHKMIADSECSPEEQVMQKQHRAHVLNRMTPLARRVVELLENPPPELMAEVRALQARARFARERGLHAVAPKGVTLGMVYSALGLPKFSVRRQRLNHELVRRAKMGN